VAQESRRQTIHRVKRKVRQIKTIGKASGEKEERAGHQKETGRRGGGVELGE